jgi:hypothetical protein
MNLSKSGAKRSGFKASPIISQHPAIQHNFTSDNFIFSSSAQLFRVGDGVLKPYLFKTTSKHPPA